MPWFLIEGFLIVTILIVYVTQILIPILIERPVFPIFRWNKVSRKRAHEAEEQELDEAWKDVDTESSVPPPNEGEDTDNGLQP